MISVVLATHRDDQFVRPAIDSILAQKDVDFELIIVANNCPVSYFEKLKAIGDARIRVFHTMVPQIAFNLNFGIEQAQYDLIARMDADDLMKPGRLKEQCDHFLKNPGLSVLGSQVEFISADGHVMNYSSYPVNDADIRKSLAFKSTFCHPSIMFRKHAIMKSGGYLGGFLSEDYDLWLRLLEDKSVQFGNTEKVLLSYRRHGNSTQGKLKAYSEVAGHLLKMFLLHRKGKYFFGALVAIAKALVRGKRD